jgi:hypothetical protein
MKQGLHALVQPCGGGRSPVQARGADPGGGSGNCNCHPSGGM